MLKKAKIEVVFSEKTKSFPKFLEEVLAFEKMKNQKSTKIKIVWKKPVKKLPGLDLDFMANHLWQHFDEIQKKAGLKIINN